jgi:hypothetical protein
MRFYTGQPLPLTSSSDPTSERRLRRLHGRGRFGPRGASGAPSRSPVVSRCRISGAFGVWRHMRIALKVDDAYRIA